MIRDVILKISFLHLYEYYKPTEPSKVLRLLKIIKLQLQPRLHHHDSITQVKTIPSSAALSCAFEKYKSNLNRHPI